jgi:hypothetical protein
MVNRMTDTRTDLPSREEIVERMAKTRWLYADSDEGWRKLFREQADAALSALTLLDLAAEMLRRGAWVGFADRDDDPGARTVQIAAYIAPPRRAAGEDTRGNLSRCERRRMIDADTIEELDALAWFNDGLGGPHFIMRNHWRDSG